MLETRVSLIDVADYPTIDLASIAQALPVPEHLSFRQTADVLGVRQSAVSHCIRSLEDILGILHFERYHGGVRVAASGARFLDRARSAIAQLDHAVKTAGAAGRGENGYLRVGILSSIATGFLRESIRTARFECEPHERNDDCQLLSRRGGPSDCRRRSAWMILLSLLLAPSSAPTPSSVDSAAAINKRPPVIVDLAFKAGESCRIGAVLALHHDRTTIPPARGISRRAPAGDQG